MGRRIKLQYTRKIIDAIHSGELLKANYKKTDVFGLEIPTELEGVPSEILDPINTVRCPSHECIFQEVIFLSWCLMWVFVGCYDDSGRTRQNMGRRC